MLQAQSDSTHANEKLVTANEHTDYLNDDKNTVEEINMNGNENVTIKSETDVTNCAKADSQDDDNSLAHDKNGFVTMKDKDLKNEVLFSKHRNDNMESNKDYNEIGLDIPHITHIGSANCFHPFTVPIVASENGSNDESS